MRQLSKIWMRFCAIAAAIMLTFGTMVLPACAEGSVMDTSASLGFSSEDNAGFAQSVEDSGEVFTKGLGFVFGYNDNEEVVSLSAAVMGRNGEDSYIWANAGDFTDNTVTHFRVFTSSGILKNLEFMGASKTNYTAQFKLAAGETMDDSFLPIVSAYRGSTVSLQYMKQNEDNSAGTAEITGLTVSEYDDSGEFTYLTVQNLPSGYDGFLPASMVDENGNLVAVVDASGRFWALILDKENFNTGAPAAPSTEKPETTSGSEPTEKPETEAPVVTETKSNTLSTVKLILNIIRIIISIGIIICAVKLMRVNKEKKNASRPPKQGAGEPPKQGELVMEDVSKEAAVAEDDALSVTKPVMPETTMVEDVGATMPVMPETTMVEDIGVTAPVKTLIKKNIIAVDGPLKGQEFTLTENETMTIGRGTTSEVVFPADTQGVSRVHCCLRIVDGKLMIEDMGSTYGTFITGVGRLNAREGVEIKEKENFYLGQEENKFEVQ